MVVVEEVAGAEVKMKTLNCPLCHQEVYSKLGKGCKMCGMPLEDESREFCSRVCREKYLNIHRMRKVHPLLTQSLNS